MIAESSSSENGKNIRFWSKRLANLGNTCFINSAIQKWSHTYELVNLDKDYKKTKQNTRDFDIY